MLTREKILEILHGYSSEIQEMFSRFSEPTNWGMHIHSEDEHRFEILVQEVIDLIGDHIPNSRHKATNIRNYYNSGVSNMYGSSSYESLKQVQGVIDSLITRIERTPDLLKPSGPRVHENQGGPIFIGHGHSQEWRALKDFATDRLKLRVEEFNRVPVAGRSTVDRLKEMLDTASFAFLIMTAEDEQPDGRIHARMNVVHEAGLFQGRLGFHRAILVLEDGCEEFSNINGLGQIRFSKSRISGAFEDIRKVLEREGFIGSDESP